ncbi:MAG: cyclic pyranopterin monophosphate synthase MoaC [Trueperaceae bacterium]|nr:cyclic pyranopterin monophosphate synthase MoaC [Trueperaceae bacterium]
MLTHFKDGKAVMVDVSGKADTVRVAVAESSVWLPEAARAALEQGGVGKGDPVAVAELAGIMGAKRTSELIPLCHPLPLSKVEVTGEHDGDVVRFTATCKTTGPTGVEMEALTAASIAALTLYDMLKAASKGLVIRDTKLLRKEGGESGVWQR